MLMRPSGKSCGGMVCEKCSSRPGCEYVEAAARWECERLACPKRNRPGQCLCATVMPTVQSLLTEFYGEEAARQ